MTNSDIISNNIKFNNEEFLKLQKDFSELQKDFSRCRDRVQDLENIIEQKVFKSNIFICFYFII